MSKAAANSSNAPRYRRKTPSRLREWAPVALAALLLLLLAVLAAMQHHWLGRASEADLQRTSASLQAAASRFAADFNRELGDLLGELVPVIMRGPGGQEIVASVERWQERANYPGLVRGVWQITLAEDGPRVLPLSLGDSDAADPPEQGAEGSSVGSAGGQGPPEELQKLASLLAERVTEERDPDQNPFLEHPRVLMAEVPAIVIPRPAAFQHGRHGGPGPDDRHPRRRHWRQWLADPGDEPPAVWVILLAGSLIRDQILPDLAQRHFSAETELMLRVLDSNRETVWSSSAVPDLDSGRGAVVAEAELFGPFRPRHEPGFGPRRRGGLYAPIHEVLAVAAGIDRGQWTLEVVHPAGSLDEAVASARHRSLMLSLFILLVLAGSILLLAHGARRAQALARRQMEFVAGVTHELRTPVAALRSAGQNLADGVVKPERVKTYGELVDREGRRLEGAVDQILAFAGLSTGSANRRATAAPLDPVRAVNLAVEELKPLLAERSVTVDVSGEEDLPNVLADADSLGRALRNLIQNAALHGRGPDDDVGWVGVDVESRDGRILFHVRDRGPGVDPPDRKRIFEPFVRGSGLAASNVPGSGLGLALVRQVADAYGGSVSLDQGAEFTTFTLALPMS